MRQENQALSTTASTVEKRDFYEIIMIINPGTTGITAFINLRGGPATSADVPILSGGPPLTITLGPNDRGASIVAASATPTVILLRESFQTEDDYLAFGPIFIAVAAALANYWIAVSATQVALAGAFVEARADTVRAKTTGQPFVAQNDQGNNGLTLGAGANGNAELMADGVGSARISSSDQSDFFHAATGASFISRNSGNNMAFTDSESNFRDLTNKPVVFYSTDATTAERHRFNSTDRYMRTVSAAAPPSNNTVFDCLEIPIVNGAVLNPGDLAEYPLGSIRVQPNALGSLGIEGVVITGGTGNAAGTVTALVRFCGILTQTLVADTGGVIQGQNLIGGGTNVGRVNSQANIEGTFAHCLTTAVATALTDARLNGVH